jgi:nicotinate-nucleotide adenylyltransferase
MTRAATSGNPLFEVSEIELEREGPSYTVDTLRHLRSRYHEAEFFLLLGADQWAEFREWRSPGEIAELATLVVMARDGFDLDRLPRIRGESGEEWRVRSLTVTRVDVSSSGVRARVRAGRSIQYLVPNEVRRIIETQGLYRSIS